MKDKEFNDCMDKLAEATSRLDATTEKMSKIVDKMIDYCIIVSLIMFITVIIVTVF